MTIKQKFTAIFWRIDALNNIIVDDMYACKIYLPSVTNLSLPNKNIIQIEVNIFDVTIT